MCFIRSIYDGMGRVILQEPQVSLLADGGLDGWAELTRLCELALGCGLSAPDNECFIKEVDDLNPSLKFRLEACVDRVSFETSL